MLMDNMRHTFIPLPFEYNGISIPNELMVDYEKGSLYIKNSDGNNIELGRYNIMTNIEENINDLLDGVVEDGNTLRKLRELIRDIEQWKIAMMEKAEVDDSVNTLIEIIDKFKDMQESAPTLKEQFDKKVDVVEGKELSTNDLTDILLQKINNIEEEANNYKHPLEKQCNYEAPVSSVNNKTGNVLITARDIGLGGVDPNANNYVHPNEKQCTAKVVTSVNNKVGSVTLNKSDIGLSNIQNYGFATETDMNNKANNKYISPSVFKEYVENNLASILRLNGYCHLLKNGDVVSAYDESLLNSNCIDAATPGFNKVYLKDNRTVEHNGNTIAGKFKYISASLTHGTLIRDDGSIEVICDEETSSTYEVINNIPTGNDYVQVSSGYNYSVALKSDGSILSWGENSSIYGYPISNSPKGNDYIYITSNTTVSVAIKKDNSFVIWGDYDDSFISIPKYKKFTKVAIQPPSSRLFMGLELDGSIYVYGDNKYGAISDKPLGNNFIDISISYRCYALDSNGKLYTWG